MGGGIKEKVIGNALVVELTVNGLTVEKEPRIDIYYQKQKVGAYIPDLVINGKIMLELKSKPFITREDEKQFWSYLKGTSYQLGFLIGFTPQKLEIKRFVYTKPKPPSLPNHTAPVSA